MSTRIIVVRYPGGNGTQRELGLIAEKATETVRLAPSDFTDSGVVSDGAPYLGPVAADPNGLVQWIEVTKILPAAVRDVLFKQAQEQQ
jgi:chemotaxis-related protein WspB